MKIEQITKYKIGSCEFLTEEDAKNYLKREEDSNDIFIRNLSILIDYVKQTGEFYVPAVDEDGNLRLFYSSHDNDSRNDWKELFQDECVRYIEWSIKLISKDEFIKIFCSEDLNCIIDADQIGTLIGVICSFLKNDVGVDQYRKILDALSRMQYHPVYVVDRD